MKIILALLAVLLLVAPAHSRIRTNYQSGNTLYATDFNRLMTDIDEATNGVLTDAQMSGTWTCQKVGTVCLSSDCRRDPSNLFYTQDFTTTFSADDKTVTFSSTPWYRNSTWPPSGTPAKYLIKNNIIFIYDGGSNVLMNRVEKKSASTFFMDWDGNSQGAEILCNKN